MSDSSSPERKVRLHARLIEWIEEQIHRGALRPGDRLPPERKLVEQFGISRTVVREALRALAARGLVESHVGRGTFVRLPAVEHLARKLRIIRDGEAGDAVEALLHVVASLAEVAAQRCTAEALAALEAAKGQGEDAFLHGLGGAAQNALLETLARALAQAAGSGTLIARVDVERVVRCIAEGRPDAARQAVLGSRSPQDA